MAGTIVISGGAGFRSGPAGLEADRRVLALTGLERPKVCYLPTAAGDSDHFIASFYASLGPLCSPSHLQLFLPPHAPAGDALLNQDVIYVAGGNTVSLLAVWRAHGVDLVLREALDNGAILYGHSAGGLCWFEGGTSGSVDLSGELRVINDGLGFLSGSHCPHFDVPTRRSSYRTSVSRGLLPPGIALEEYALARFDDAVLTGTLSVDHDHGVFAVGDELSRLERSWTS